ncbi:MAG: TonB-dependent receptor [Burkholderiaceae bacterium]|nr:TonB-dependent receptor [Burkholderiaceae bacterium]
MIFQRSALARAALCALSAAAVGAHAHQVPKTLAPVVVTADPFGSSESGTILAPARVVSGDELRDKLGGSLGETLIREPGVNASGFSTGSSRPVIRGLEGPRVKILQDGMGSGDLSAISNDHAVGSALLTAQQIEILRGPATLLYGSGAIGGAINIVNGRIPIQLEPRPTGEAELRAGSADRSGALAFSADRSVGNIGLHVDGSLLRAGDYRIPGNSAVDGSGGTGRLPFSGSRDDNLGVGASLIQSWGHVGASLAQTDKLYGIHGRDENAKIDLAQTRFDIDSLVRSPLPGFDALRVKLGRNNYRHTELEDGTEPHVRFSNRSLESRWELSHLPLAGWRGKLGLQTDNATVQALNLEGEDPTVPRTRSASTAAFVVEEKDFGSVRLNAGARLEQVNRRPIAETRRNFTLASTSVGALWTYTPGYALGLTGSLAQRAPTAEELYSGGVHHPTETFDRGDSALRKETSQNLDLSWQKTEDRLRWRANLFQNKISNFVFGRIGNEVCEDGSTPSPGCAGGEDPLRTRNFSQADATLRGYEVDVSYNLYEVGWFGRAFADSSRGKLNNLGNLPLQPANRVGVTVGYQDNTWRSSLSVLNASAQNRIAGADVSDERVTRGYTRVDASLSWRQRHGTTDLTWFLLARNLLNEEIRLSTSLLKDYVPQAGRHLMVGVRARF